MANGARSHLGVTAVVAAAVIAAAGFRLTTEGRSELAASDAAWAKWDAAAAALHARRAAGAYVPFAAHMERGYQRLRDVAETSERKGDTSAALFAWRAILAAAAGSRPFSAACGDICPDAEASAMRLSAALQASGRGATAVRRGASVDGSPSSANVVPGVAWGALVLAGAALGWSAGLRFSRAWRGDGGLLVGQARLAAGIGAAGLVAWLVGLLLA